MNISTQDGSPTVEDTSSVSTETTNSSSAETQTSDATAPTSSAQGETKETLLDAVQNVLKTDATEEGKATSEDAPASTEPKPDDQSGEKDAAPEIDLDKDPTKEELSRYHSKTRKRIEKLLSERNSYKEEALVARGVREYLVQHDIAKEDFQLTLDLAAAMRRGDFKGFLEGVAPYVNLAEQALGITLPPDLQQQVQQGYMTTEAAQNFSRERYARQLAEQNVQRVQSAQQTQQVQQQRSSLAQSIETTVSTWENNLRQTDPDYGRKEAAVKDFLWSVVRERGNPQTPQQALEIAQEAYARANNLFRSFAPKPQPTKATPSSTQRIGGVRPEPKSLMEAATLALESSRR